MSNYKPFWQNKPILRKLVAVIVIIFMPAFLMVLRWHEIKDVLSENYKEAWSVITGDDDA